MKPGRIPLPALGVAGLLIMVGHDVLMTVNPHEQESAHVLEPGTHEVDCHTQKGIRLVAHDPSDPKPTRLACHKLLAAVAPQELPGVSWAEEPTTWP